MDSGVTTVDQRGCPSDEELADFVEHALPPERRAQLEGHLDRCATCREAIGHVASTAPEGPKKIGRYRLDRKLGAGGMGVVWQAWDPALEREIAIKLLHLERNDALGRDRAIREARALARLQHPNVVAVYDVGEHEGDVFIAMELVDGQSLDKWQKGKSPAEIIAAFAQAARGLSAAHRLELVHRDVKPSNILVASDGRVRIGDFGLATNAAANSLERPPPTLVTPARAPLPKLTYDGERLGTPAYMAPEQQLSTAVDARADQFSLCLALAEALLGKLPKPDPTAEELADSGVPAPWPAIARGLAMRPSDRFPDLDPLVAALEGKRPHRVPRRAWIAGGAALAAVGGVIAWRVAARETSTPESAPAPPTVTQAGGGGTGKAPPTLPGVLPPWTWTTPTTGPWRLAEQASYVAMFDATHAVALSLDELMVIDLGTGAVTLPVDVTTGRIDGVARIDGRVLAFGMKDSKPLAWQIAISPPGATEIPLPDPVPEDPPVFQWGGGAMLTPDGTKLVLCMNNRWPTVRDPKTFDVIRVLKGIDCRDARFPDATHMVVGSLDEQQLVDLTTGAVSKLKPGAPRLTMGAKSLVFSDGEDTYKVIGANGAVKRTRRNRRHYEDITFTPDGNYAVGLRLGSLTIRPTSDDGMDREIELPTVVPAMAVDNTTALIVAENVVIAVDLANGTVRHASGNLESIQQVGPRAGAVIVASDRLRMWREGVLVATTDPAREFGLGAPTAPVTVLGFDHVGQWDPATGERRMLRSFTHFGLDTHLSQLGDVYAFNDGRTMYRGKGDAPPVRWFSYRDDLELEVMDLQHERIAWELDDMVLVGDLKANTVWPISVPGFDDDKCEAGSSLRFSPDGTSFAIDAGGKVILFDIATKTRIGNIDMPKMMQLEWDFLPSGKLLFAGPGEIAIYDPKTKKAVGWHPPIKERPVRLAVDAKGAELAVAYANGSVLWADVAQLELHSTRRDVTIEPVPRCADRKLPQPKLGQLVTR